MFPHAQRRVSCTRPRPASPRGRGSEPFPTRIQLENQAKKERFCPACRASSRDRPTHLTAPTCSSRRARSNEPSGVAVAQKMPKRRRSGRGHLGHPQIQCPYGVFGHVPGPSACVPVRRLIRKPIRRTFFRSLRRAREMPAAGAARSGAQSKISGPIFSRPSSFGSIPHFDQHVAPDWTGGPDSKARLGLFRTWLVSAGLGLYRRASASVRGPERSPRMH